MDILIILMILSYAYCCMFAIIGIIAEVNYHLEVSDTCYNHFITSSVVWAVVAVSIVILKVGGQ